MNTKQLTAFAEGMMRETSAQTGEWVTVSRIALDEMARETLQAIKALKAAARELMAAESRLHEVSVACATAERERDELRAEQAEHDEQIARMDGKCNLAKRALDSKTERCDKAEAELALRDAAAVTITLRPFGEDSQNCFVRCDENHPFAVKLYTNAPPAVLPPDWSDVPASLAGDLSDAEEGYTVPLYTIETADSAPDGLAAAVNRLLDSDGSRGRFSAIRLDDALAEVERLLAAAPAPGEK